MKSLNHIQHFFYFDLIFLSSNVEVTTAAVFFCNTLVERRTGHYKTKAFAFDFQSLEIFLVSKQTYYYAWNKRKKTNDLDVGANKETVAWAASRLDH